MNRRSFLGAILAAGIAPAYVKASSLMPVVSRIWVPSGGFLMPMWAAKELSWVRFYDGPCPVDASGVHTGKLLLETSISAFGSTPSLLRL